MTDETNNTSGKAPTHSAVIFRKGKEGKDFPLEIGAAWPAADPENFNVVLYANPLDGRFALCVRKKQ